MNVPPELIDQFVTLTQAEPAIAKQLLGDNNLNLEAAISSFFAIQDAEGIQDAPEVVEFPSRTTRHEPSNVGVGPAASSRDDNVFVIDDDDEPQVIATNSIAHDEAFARQLASEEEPEVRAPLPERIEQILPPERRHVRPRRAPTNTDPFVQSDGSAHGNLLAELFQPPTDINDDSSFDSVSRRGQQQKKWILVNMQRADLFPCHVLNRDIWADPAVRDMVQAHFVLWQREEDSEDGVQYKRFYFYESPPHIAIIDPRSRERLAVWGGDGNPIDKNAFLSSLVDFCDSHSLENAHVHPGAPSSWTRSSSTGGLPSSSFEPRRNYSTPSPDADQDLNDTEEAYVAAAIAASMNDVEAEHPTARASQNVSANRDSSEDLTTAYASTPMELERQTSRLMSATDPELNMHRSLRAQQDSEYEQSLALDRAKAQSEKEEKSRLERAASLLDEKRARIPAAPPANCDQPTAELLIRLPSGKRMQRRFYASNTIGDVYDFVDVESGSELQDDSYCLVSPFPRKSFSDRSVTLSEADLSNKAVLVVDRL